MKKLPVAAVLLTALSACVLPDEFNSTIEISGTGYAIDYDGQMIFVPLYAELQSGDADDDDPKTAAMAEEFGEELKKGLGEDARRSDIEVSYRGVGRYQVSAEVEGDLPSAGRKASFVDIFSLKNANGQIHVSSAKIKKKDLDQMRQAGLTASGKLCVETDLPVISHNADHEPGFMSPGYCWDLNLISGDQVEMTLDATKTM